MKNFLFGLIAFVAFSVSGFAANENPKLDSVAQSIKPLISVVLLSECSTCPDNCCLVIINNPDGGAGTLKTCCANVKVVKVPGPKKVEPKIE